jgi:hypothetical protein
MVTVGRHINGITINPLEYLLDDSGEPIEFTNEESAKSYLREHGVTEEEIYWMVFESVPARREAAS